MEANHGSSSFKLSNSGCAELLTDLEESNSVVGWVAYSEDTWAVVEDKLDSPTESNDSDSAIADSW